MVLIILLALVLVPVAEIAVFIEVGGRIGLGSTLLLVVLTAIAGTALLRHQGLATLARAQQSLERNEFPVNQVFDGLCLLVAGALLLTPGFVTDGLGLLLFAPPFRALLKRFAWTQMVQSGHFHMATSAPPPGWQEPGNGGMGNGSVIDGEFEVVNGQEEKGDPDKPGDGGSPPAPR